MGNTTDTRYAVYSTDRDGSPNRLEWLGEAVDADDAIRKHLDEIGADEADALVAVEAFAFVVEGRDENGQWAPEHVGKVLYWRTEEEAEKCLAGLVQSMGWGEETMRVSEVTLPDDKDYEL